EKRTANYSGESFNLSAHKGLMERIDKIDQTIAHYLETDKGQPPVLYDAAHHLIERGGKRIRSLLTLLACEAVNGDIKNALKVALAAELIQTASLINDDIIDDDYHRRGVETVHRKYGQDIAILASNLLVGQAVRITAEIGLPKLLVHMAIGGIRMCEGETQDIIMSVENQNSYNEDVYFKMVGNKTVAFMKQAVKVGCLIGSASDPQIAALTTYAEALGYSFQLRDDILDISVAPEQVQKTKHSDLRMKRGNLVVIHALNSSQKSDRTHSLKALDKGDFAPLLELIDSTNALNYTFNLAKSFNARAKSALRGKGFATEKLLEQLADYALLRDH
ncbi:MAG: polyprenyl synthetase family protein, partial [Candidatus Hermodarchaeota archaeon]|nr:polyprenyl synthetase family protein [Candidatus Hermodarchaeota archaeon]